MERLLNAIVSELQIKTTTKELSKYLEGDLPAEVIMTDYRDVPEETREVFKTKFNNHLFTKLQEIEIGESVDYAFDFGIVRPMGKLMVDANNNLAEVLLMLPSLMEGESYCFPRETFISFTLADKDETEVTVNPDVVCGWIMDAYKNQ